MMTISKWKSLAALTLVCTAVVVWMQPFAHSASRLTQSGEQSTTPRRKHHQSRASEFPYALKFKQGAARFLEGDDISILEVHGTADTMQPGNIYWIKGTYKLSSHDRAMLAAFTTARSAEDDKGAYLKVQTAKVGRGAGTFTIFLPMSYEGWPHVSFYPADGGDCFSGNYFGTDGSVLKEGWGSKKAH
jgi:hypothetical protein